MKIITILGARPQFIKAAMLSHAIAQHNASHPSIKIEEKILHTGQHYDYEMSEIFVEELHIPTPMWNLGCTLPPQEMSQQIIPILREERPNCVVVYGDTNSTLAGALAAHACDIPIAHIEAGLRSFNARMAEEYNRIETDKLSYWLFCPTYTAVENLRRDGINAHVYHVGDVMYDAALQAEQHPCRLDISLPQEFALVTVHRAENTDETDRLALLLTAFGRMKMPIVWPMHPRTRKVIEAHEELETLLRTATNIQVIDSQGYAAMAALEQQAKIILTDSGGVQKEAYFHRTPCVTLREETEWTETVEAGWNRLVGSNVEQILQSVIFPPQPQHDIDDYGDGHAANKIVDCLCAYC